MPDPIQPRPERQKFVIGKDAASCEIVLSDASISKRHCSLIVEGDGTYSIADMGSVNGVYLKKGGDWVRIKDERVEPTDFVRIGHYEVSVSSLLLQLQGVPQKAPRLKDKIFISYRRSDTEQVAGRIFDRLSSEYGDGKVFFDTDAIPGAVDFRVSVQAAIQQSAVLLAIIGRNWFVARRGPSLFRKLFGERQGTDFVQGELETAVQWSVPVVPLLVDGGSMPAPNSLPDPIRDIAFLNAMTIRGGRDFATDMEAVLKTISRYLPPPMKTVDTWLDPFRE